MPALHWASRRLFHQPERLFYSYFRQGLAWIPAGHILRMSPPIVMDLDAPAKCMDIIDDAVGEAERHFGYSR